MIDVVPRKGKRIIISLQLQMQILNQVHSNHMGIEKTRLLACDTLNWVNMNANIENAIKHCSAFLEY